MTTEQLTGLQLAVKLIAQIGDDESDRAISAVHHAADQAQRVADLGRLNGMHKAAWLAYQPLGDYMQALSMTGKLPVGTLGRHLGDVAIERMQAQEARIAELERHAANLVSESDAKITAMQAAFEERLTLDRANRLLVKRIADLETKCCTLKELHDAAADERDEWRRISSAYSPQKELSTALEQAKESGRRARKERDELRKELDCAEEAADVAACSLVIEDSDGYECVSSYIRAVTQQLVKERDALRARLAEIEAQEPAAWQQRTQFDGEWSGWQDCNWRTANLLRQREDYEVRPVYARPVTAIPDGEPLTCDVCGVVCRDPWHYSSGERRHLHACETCWPGVSPAKIPDGWRLVPVEPTIAMCIAGDSPRMLVDDCTPTPAIYRAMIAAAPEAAR